MARWLREEPMAINDRPYAFSRGLSNPPSVNFDKVRKQRFRRNTEERTRTEEARVRRRWRLYPALPLDGRNYQGRDEQWDQLNAQPGVAFEANGLMEPNPFNPSSGFFNDVNVEPVVDQAKAEHCLHCQMRLNDYMEFAQAFGRSNFCYFCMLDAMLLTGRFEPTGWQPPIPGLSWPALTYEPLPIPLDSTHAEFIEKFLN